MRAQSYVVLGSNGGQSSAGTGTVVPVNIPKGTSAVILSAATNSAIVTFDGTTPTATVGHTIPNTGANPPVLIPITSSATLQFCSSQAAAASVLTVTFLE